jgi:hypothetical protein
MKVFLLGTGATGGLLAQILRREGHHVTRGDVYPKRAVPFAGNGTNVVKVNAPNCERIADAAAGTSLTASMQSGFGRAIKPATKLRRSHTLRVAPDLHLQRCAGFGA